MGQIEARREAYIAKFIAAGHTPVVAEDGDTDFFAYDGDTHNGLQCSKCFYADCWHCMESKELPKCTVTKELAEAEGEGTR